MTEITFLFTDIEGSTRLLDAVGEARYEELLAQHRIVLRDVFARHGGVEVDTQGDAFFYVFEDPGAALQAAGEGQAALADGPVAVRMGAHTGEAIRGESGYVGREVHRAARIGAAGHGGQVVVSAATAALAGTGLTALGEHLLKDFDEPLALFQLGDAEFPPLKTTSNTNLPRPASSFVGREREVREVAALVRANRLVTLTGPGGSGKTRLAIESAAELVGDVPAGVFWVGLASLRDPRLVLQTVAQTLGAKEDLRTHIGEREILLLLDNLEQVIDASPEVAALVEACPHLRLLVTSRELLRVRGEVDYEVLPLAEPDAVELFCTRAEVEASAAVDELCRRLDNLPLALELAAARANALTPDQILERLAQRLDLLKGGRDADPRQATLRATIEWSHDLLGEEEQKLLRRFSVFAGACTIEAAEEVAGADLDVLQSLVEKSLVRRSDNRFWMLETIREFAAERLAGSGEAASISRDHAAWFAALAARYDDFDRWGGVETTSPERDNLRVALASAIAAAEYERSVVVACAFARLSGLSVTASEAMQWLEAVLELEGLDGTQRLRVLLAAAATVQQQNELERAEGYASEALALARELGDPRRQGQALTTLAIVMADRQSWATSVETFRTALDVFTEIGSERDVTSTLFHLGFVSWARGDLEAARGFGEASLERARLADDRYAKMRAANALAGIRAQAGEPNEALPLLREALLDANDLGDVYAVSNCLDGAAGIVLHADAERATVLLGGAEALRQSLDIVLDPANAQLQEQMTGEVRDRVAQRFGELWAHGRAMDRHDLVAYTLEAMDAVQA
jgi:predicted ATPase